MQDGGEWIENMHSNPASYLWRSTCSLQSKYPHKIPYDIASLKHFVGTCLWPCPAIGWLFDLLYSTCTQRCQTNFKIVATISTCGSNRGKDEYHALFHVHKRDILPSWYVSNDGAPGKLLYTLCQAATTIWIIWSMVGQIISTRGKCKGSFMDKECYQLIHFQTW